MIYKKKSFYILHKFNFKLDRRNIYIYYMGNSFFSFLKYFNNQDNQDNQDKKKTKKYLWGGRLLKSRKHVHKNRYSKLIRR